MVGRFSPAAGSWAPPYLGGSQVLYPCLPLLKYLPVAPGAVRTNILDLCGTMILWCWESLKCLIYCQRFPRDCSECKALNTCESIIAGSGPECINFSHSHLANNLIQTRAGSSQVQPNQSQVTPRLNLARHPPRPSSDSSEHRHGWNAPEHFAMYCTCEMKTSVCISLLIKMLLLVHLRLLEDDRPDPLWMVPFPAMNIYILHSDYITSTSSESANLPPLN